MSDSETRCFHCGLPVPANAGYEVEIDGATRPMCCPGCQAVAQAIVDQGLTDFYRYRTTASRNPGELIPQALQGLDLYDRPELQSSFVERQPGESREASLILEGIVCAACVWLSEHHVRALDGVESFHVNYATHRARVRWDDGRIHLSAILKAIAAIGYVAHPFDPGRQEQLQRREKSVALRRIAVAGLGAMQVMMLAIALYAGAYSGMEPELRDFMRWVSLVIAIPVVVYAAQPFFLGAWRDLRRRRPGMDVPVALAIGAAFCASAWATVSGGGEVYFDSVSMFTFFLLVGRYLEMKARHLAGQAAEELVRLMPATATQVDADGEHVVAVAELTAGDTVLIRPGETVPADGVVCDGVSSVDESLLTGESLPLARGAGEPLVGGSLNVESPLRMRVTAVGESTVLASVVRLLDRAQTEKPRLARLADRVAGWFVGAILLFAALVAWFWWQRLPEDAFWITLSVLVVTCPCALSLATPAALTAGTSRLTRMGVLTTRGHAVETLARASHILLDKTGTLTEGQLRLTHSQSFGTCAADDCLALAAGLERGSEHPVARALMDAAVDSAPLEDVIATPGQGVEGLLEGRRYRIGRWQYVQDWAGGEAPAPMDTAASADEAVTTVWLAAPGELLAGFSLADRLRAGAAEAVTALRRAGLEVHLISGDRSATVQRVATEVGIATWRGAMLPADKLTYVRELQNAGAVVAMVGDGVNDAPVLAGAQVSVAMGQGSQLAQAHGDMVLLAEDLRRLPEALFQSRRTLGVIRQNLSWAVLYNLIALPVAAAGWVAPWMAALGMSASSLVVVLNALRLAPARHRAPSPSGDARADTSRGRARDSAVLP